MEKDFAVIHPSSTHSLKSYTPRFRDLISFPSDQPSVSEAGELNFCGTVAGAIGKRSSEMVDALYSMNDGYQESSYGASSSKKTEKRAIGKRQPTITFKLSDEQFVLHSQTIASSYDCLSLLRQKCSGGAQPRAVGKRTPRFPISYTHVNISRKNFNSPTRQGLKIMIDANDDEELREIPISLADARKDGSPLVSRKPNKRAEDVMSSPVEPDHQPKDSMAKMDDSKLFAIGRDEEDLEGPKKAVIDKRCRNKPYMMEPISCGTDRQKRIKLTRKKCGIYNDNEENLDGIRKELCGKEEGHLVGATRSKFAIRDNDAKIFRPSMQSQRNKNKKILFRRDEDPSFDALKTLADLSSMMPTENGDGSKLQLNSENIDHVNESLLEALPMSQQKRTCRSSRVKMEGHKSVSSFEVASRKTSKSGKGSVVDVGSIPEENRDPHSSIPKRTRKKQKIHASEIQKTEAHYDIQFSESPGIEAQDVGKREKLSQGDSLEIMTNIENFPNQDLEKKGSCSEQSAIPVPVVTHVDSPAKGARRRKMDLKKLPGQKDLKFPQKISNDQSSLPFASLQNAAFNLEENLSCCLSNNRLRKWCTYEWFYSAIDYPWFANAEFVEYLSHVGLVHLPALTRVEWGVIKSSLGTPRLFSKQFLKEERNELEQYRDSVRKHYSELREGVRDSLSTDLGKPLSVGQHVIAIHPKTGELHNGSVLTVDFSRCQVQFDRHELGVEFVKDIDCMPSNPSENMPASLERHSVAVDNKVFANFSELKQNGPTEVHMKLSPGDYLDNINDISQLSSLAHPISSLQHMKVASAKPNVPTMVGPAGTYQQTAYTQRSTPVQFHAKEADVNALTELTHALDKKEAVVLELRRMNDVMENPKDGDSSLNDSEVFKKQYAAVLTELSEANEEVSSALFGLRCRNTYRGNSQLTSPIPVSIVPDGALNSSGWSAFQAKESRSHVAEIIDGSRTRAEMIVDAAMQEISSLKNTEDTVEKIENALGYGNNHIPPDDSCMPMPPKSELTNASIIQAQIPSELITKCVAALLMIQNCTERRIPPSDIAQILDSAVTSLRPRSLHNLPVYTEIQRCMGIIRNQIIALVPT